MSQVVIPQTSNQVQFVQTVQPTNRALKYAKTFKGIGITQIILGVISIGLGIALIVFGVNSYYIDFFALIGSAIWGGAFTVINGGLSFAAGKAPNDCLVISGLVFSIISSLAQLAVFGLAVTGSILSNSTASLILNAIVCVVSFPSIVLGIVQASYSCMGLTCCCTDNQSQVIYINQMPPNYVVPVQPDNQPQMYQQPPLYQPNQQQPAEVKEPLE